MDLGGPSSCSCARSPLLAFVHRRSGHDRYFCVPASCDALLVSPACPGMAGGIDHRRRLPTTAESGSGATQQALIYTLIGGEIVGALWEGGEIASWQNVLAVDRFASAIGAVSSEALANIFTRSRPDQSPTRTFGSRARAITAFRAARSRWSVRSSLRSFSSTADDAPAVVRAGNSAAVRRHRAGHKCRRIGRPTCWPGSRSAR